MSRQLTVEVSDTFYEALEKSVGLDGAGSFLERVAEPHLSPVDLDAEYKAMAADEDREREAREWDDAETGETLPDEDWSWLRDAEGRGVVGEIRSGGRRRNQED